MYKLYLPCFINDERNDAKIIPIIKKLLIEVLGYTEAEVDKMGENKFSCDVVKHITLEQALLIDQPFSDYDIHIYLKDEDTNKFVFYKDVCDITTLPPKQPPKERYYDKPVVSREHLINPFDAPKPQKRVAVSSTPVASKYIPKCPTCGSPDVQKIGTGEKVVSGAFWGLFSTKIRKSYKCKNCKYMW